MNVAPHEQADDSNASALRTLRTLQRALRRQIDALMAIECEDAEAADAVRFAVDALSRALDNAAETRRRIATGE
ncbi:MAG TPA: hypothetical protein VGE52_16930 [Pirellulales bacterium]